MITYITSAYPTQISILILVAWVSSTLFLVSSIKSCASSWSEPLWASVSVWMDLNCSLLQASWPSPPPFPSPAATWKRLNAHSCSSWTVLKCACGTAGHAFLPEHPMSRPSIQRSTKKEDSKRCMYVSIVDWLRLRDPVRSCCYARKMAIGKAVPTLAANLPDDAETQPLKFTPTIFLSFFHIFI